MLGMYIIAYGQGKDAYISLMQTCKELANKEIILSSCSTDDDVFVFLVKYITRNSLKSINSLNKFTKKEINDWVLQGREVVDNNYDQAWHLLVSYIMYQELNGKYHFSKVGEIENLSVKFKYYSDSHCEEFILWMAIVAGIDSCKIYEAFKVAVDFEKKKEKKKDACQDIRKYISWKMIEDKIRLENSR